MYLRMYVVTLVLFQYLFTGVVLVTLEAGSSSFYFVASQNNYNLVRGLYVRIHVCIVSCSQTAFFRFYSWWQKKGSGYLTLHFLCCRIHRLCRALIAKKEVLNKQHL